jgi:hypothetical protein
VHDEFPEETGWTLRDSAGDLIARQFTGSYNTEGGTTVETRNITAGIYTVEMTDSAGDGICCEYGSGSFKITVDDETIISMNGEFSESVQETFIVGSYCSDLLSNCSTVRHFESRTREAHVSLAYFMGCRYHDRDNHCLYQSSHLTLCSGFCHESRLSSKSSMMTFPWKQAGRSTTVLVC